jgi:hypothetical protein
LCQKKHQATNGQWPTANNTHITMGFSLAMSRSKALKMLQWQGKIHHHHRRTTGAF